MLPWKSRPARIGNALGRIGPSDCMFTRIWVALMFMFCPWQSKKPSSSVAARKSEGTERGIGGSRDSQSSTRIINYGQNNVLDESGVAQPCMVLLYSVLLHLWTRAKDGDLSLTGLTSTAPVEY